MVTAFVRINTTLMLIRVANTSFIMYVLYFQQQQQNLPIVVKYLQSNFLNSCTENTYVLYLFLNLAFIQQGYCNDHVD